MEILENGRTVCRNWIFILCFLVLPGASRALAGEDADLELKVKATYLASFAQFVEWPEMALGAADAPIVVGVLGDDPFGNYLEQAASRKTANGRKIQIKRFQDAATAAANSHILFIGNSERQRLARVFQTLKYKPVLTVSDMPQFLNEGGMVRFVVRDERVQLEINVEKARSSELRISSKLLRLASIVEVPERR